jgi:hypothetical protein
VRQALRILRYLLAILSLLLCAATVALCVSARSHSRWATADYPPRHYGIGWFADGVALYYVPVFPRQNSSPWFVWVTSSRYAYEYVRPQASFLGFHIARNAINAGDIYVVLPYWFLIIATAIAPLLVLIRLVFGKRRRVAGLCTKCGYDLRATPQRCPECGQEPHQVVA